MDSDFPWIYVAMVFIAFVSWVRARIQEAAAFRRARAEQKEAQRKREESAPAPPEFSPYRNDSPPPAPPEPVVEEPGQPAAQPTFRELFEMLQGHLPEAEEAVPTPPPARVEVSAEARPPALPSDRTGLTEAATEMILSSPSIASTSPFGSNRVNRSKYVGRMLKSSANLREAFILKEILDKPLTLRD